MQCLVWKNSKQFRQYIIINIPYTSASVESTIWMRIFCFMHGYKLCGNFVRHPENMGTAGIEKASFGSDTLLIPNQLL